MIKLQSILKRNLITVLDLACVIMAYVLAIIFCFDSTLNFPKASPFRSQP